MWNTNSTLPPGMNIEWEGFCSHGKFYFRTKNNIGEFSFDIQVEKVCALCGGTMILEFTDFL